MILYKNDSKSKKNEKQSKECFALAHALFSYGKSMDEIGSI